MKKLTIAALLLSLPTAASAHPALAVHSHTFLTGLSHPLTGFDHLLAMISVGLWASQKGGRALWLWPVAFVAAMIAGGALGMNGFALPLGEPAIAASLLMLGLLIAAMAILPAGVGAAMIAVFGLFHGNAHGLEAPGIGISLLFGLGFVLSTATLHVAGLTLGLVAQDGRRQALVRTGAWLIAVTGAALLLT
ncbi:MAG TPA: HupE/UreJ family protein [Rhizomicrobium sp.]|nr:HupE/UreJ family protein [Rhizomicrobium sp.]